MAAAVLKMVNHQYPDMEIYVDGRHTTPLIRDVLDSCGLRHQGLVNNGRGTKVYDYVSGHMLYANIFKARRKGKVINRHFMEDMVLTFNDHTRLNLTYEPDTFCRFTGRETEVPRPHDYVLMVSCGKRALFDGGKAWKRRKFKQLAGLLARDHEIVQIGARGDPLLKAARHHYLDTNLGTLHYLMKNCRFFVGLENGLSPWAGHHAFPAFVLYCGRYERPVYSSYPGQVPIVAKSVKAFYGAICAHKDAGPALAGTTQM